jgi:hypothetical protein
VIEVTPPVDVIFVITGATGGRGGIVNVAETPVDASLVPEGLIALILNVYSDPLVKPVAGIVNVLLAWSGFKSV